MSPSSNIDRFNSKYRSKIRDAKTRARSELIKIDNGWRYMKFAQNFDLSIRKEQDKLERIDAGDYSIERFRDEFERQNRPVLITGLTEQWMAKYKWTERAFYKRYRNQLFKVGEDDRGKSVKLKMKYYVKYMSDTKDDSPLYIFDSHFGEHRKKSFLLEDYRPPVYFEDDLFRYAGERKRPPYRWIVMGPSRSGTGIHIDPLATSAWNTLLRGHKRWVLLPPETPKEMVKLTRGGGGGANKGEAIAWFACMYPKVMAADWPRRFGPIEAIQRPGETMFVPSGWWHVVLNLDSTIAITQNFSSPVNFPKVWRQCIKSRPKLARKLLKNLRECRPDLYDLAIDITTKQPSNADDEWSSSSSDSTSSDEDESEYDSDSDSESDVPAEETAPKVAAAPVTNGNHRRLPASSPTPRDRSRSPLRRKTGNS